MSRAPRVGRGFSLIEVLLALGLLAGIAGGALGLFENLTRRQEQVRGHSERTIGSGRLVQALERALATSFAQQADGSAGVRGDRVSILVHHSGVIGSRVDRAADTRSLGLEWSASDGSIRASFAGEGVEREHETLVRGVERVRFRYFEGARWRSSYDSVERGGLPSAIEMAIWYAPMSQPLRGGGPARDDRAALDTEIDAAFEAGLDAQSMEAAPPTRAPDRLRVFVIPDAPEASWEVAG